MWGRKIVVLSTLSLLSLTACKKDIVEIPEANDPVFRTSGTMGAETFEIVAGDNGAYMHTMTLVENNVDVFSGRISDGTFSVEMGIYDGNVDMPAVQPALLIGNLSPSFSLDSEQPLIKLSKAELASMAAGQYIDQIEWFVNGDFVGLNEAVITRPGKYEVCAEIMYLDGATASLCNEIIAGYELSANYMIDFSIAEAGALTASIDNMGNEMSAVKWFVDGDEIWSGEFCQTSVTAGPHILTSEVRFVNGVTRRKSALIDGSNWQHACNDFTIFEFQAPTPIDARDFNVRLLIERNGKQYSSELVNNENSSVSITGIEYYDDNANGNPVYKISADVDAMVREVGTMKNVPVSFSTIFGIEIK